MSMLIIAGLLAIGLIAIVVAIFLAMGEEKAASSATKEATATTTPSGIRSSEDEKGLVTEPYLLAIREDPQVAIISGEFRELAAQLRVLHQQAQDIERRLSLLSQAANHIERSQSANVSFTETDEYSLLEAAKTV
jgi:hypothetical protein